MKKVIILCPGDSITGGPELIHQFVDALRNRNVDAKVLYYPFDKSFETPAPYSRYDVKLATVADLNYDDELIVPEVATSYLRELNCKNKVIWWLSVDNYFKAHPKTISDRIKFLIKKYIFRISFFLSLKEMSDLKHLTQSKYGEIFLKNHGIHSVSPLSDYLGINHLNKVVDISKKMNVVAYNPKKGIEFTKKIIKCFPDIEFVPLQNMTSKEVGLQLDKSKIYIDFGEHPGKDRIPREAVMAKCVVITGIKGSANNNVDVPIPSTYKFIESESSVNEIGLLINDIFNVFPKHSSKFDDYRQKIQAEETEFMKQVDLFIESLK
ncbi:hypothetical protein L2744_11040 [Shewanella profunda]|uniref:hypothetical protein n=1 Tax=Shewanella profunda TaxID=254793 RepID=UPI00200C3ED2|nr:hypothetical protein [Shewanella profunda]MCL1090120.1 hypothetical protein [Shewanella profunda]